MPRPTVSHLSISSISLKLYSAAIPISTATGFIVRHEQALFLVSNWHVFAGVDQITGDNLDNSGLHPTRIEVTTFTAPDADSELVTLIQSIPLIDDDHEILWLMHGKYGISVDVALLPLPQNFILEQEPVNLHRLDFVGDPERTFDISPPDPVVVVGYPLGLDGGAPWVAVWVQGSIASEYKLNVGPYPRFLIDARTRSGMSGSPVYYFPRGRAAWFTDDTRDFLVSDANQILGVYSGRAHAESDLGFVWRKSLIDEILLSGVRGSIR